MADAPVWAEAIMGYGIEPIVIRDSCGAAEGAKLELL
jgi:hypothetical protein